MASIICIGSSHLFAIQSGYGAMPAGEVADTPSLSFVQLREEKYRPPFSADGKKYILNRAIRDEIGSLAKKAAPAAILTCIGGGIQHEIGLAVHPHPFDFELPGQASLLIDKSAELLPYGIVRDSLERLNRPFFTILKLVREIVPQTIFQLCPPPPLFDSNKISRLLAERNQDLKISPPYLRYKLWAVHAETVAAFCSENAISFVRPPLSTIDDAGFLKSEFVSSDAIHGNVLYGKAALLDLFSILRKELGHASL